MYNVVGWTPDLHEIVYTDQIAPYHYIYLLIPLSLFYYGSRGINSLFYIKNEQYDREIELLMVLSAIYIIIGMLYTLIFISRGVLSLETGLDYRLLIYSLSFVTCLFIIRYLCTFQKNDLVIKPEVLSKSYSNSRLKQSTTQYYQDVIVKCFENTEIYLRSDISLDVLANELDIPKHHLSQVLNVHFKKSFYSFVADYRIKYAINKIELNRGALTLESLAYESGFNSRTSFNNYFKKITGLTPADYQAQACKVVA
jgi:AraC-like DNA-binding protein